MEIKSVIWEIKRDKFWKSKVSFEKSNASNFGNQKCIWESKRDKLWKSKLFLEKSNATNLKSKWHNKNKRIFPFNHRQNIKIIQDKKRIRHSKFYLWYSSNTVYVNSYMKQIEIRVFNEGSTNYRKIRGLYTFQRPFLRGLYSEGPTYGGKFAFQNRLG